MAEKFLVNGKPMTNEEYLDLLSNAREATKSYKDTPLYKKELEAKERANQELETNIKKFEDFAKSLKVSELGISRIALVLYNKYRIRKQ